jgi:hypothetical protein
MKREKKSGDTCWTLLLCPQCALLYFLLAYGRWTAEQGRGHLLDRKTFAGNVIYEKWAMFYDELSVEECLSVIVICEILKLLSCWTFGIAISCCIVYSKIEAQILILFPLALEGALLFITVFHWLRWEIQCRDTSVNHFVTQSII